jgi:iron complex transport system permease protein
MISTPHHRLLLVGGLAAALLASAAISISVGTATIPLGEVWRTVLHPGGAPHATIIRDLRLPRTVLAIEVGVALGVAGALMQALTRNPLADPGLLGVNAGAALLVVIGITAFGVTTLTGYVWLAFVGAGGALAVVHAIGSRGAGAIPVRLALAGTALSAALTSVVIAIVLLDPAAFDTFRAWEVGSLTGRGAGE